MIIVKRLNEKDWLLLKRIRLAALINDPDVFGSSYEEEASKTEAHWRDQLTEMNSAIFGVFDGESCVGMTGVSIYRDDPSGKTAILWGSWLEPEFRGKGLSKLLYEPRMEWARNHPACEKIIVSHRASNQASKRANQKFGFTFTKKVNKQWHDGTREDELFYELRLKK